MNVISVYSAALNSGKKTIAVSLAQLSASEGKKTLLVDLDYQNSGIALTYGITNATKNMENYMKSVFDKDNFHFGDFVMNKKDFETVNKDLSKAHAAVSSNLDFLIFSQAYRISMFPKLPNSNAESKTLQVYEIVKRFIEELHQSDYDVVILNLPNHYEDMFVIPVILESDKVVNVMKFSISRIEEMKRFNRLLDKETINKFVNVLNFTVKKIDLTDYSYIAKPFEFHHFISMDEARALNEFNAEIGSPIINNVAKGILKSCDVEIVEKRKGLLFGK